MPLFLALSCLQGRPMREAFDTLAALGDGVQLTAGNVPTRGFLEHVRTSGVPTRTHHGFHDRALRTAVWSAEGACLGRWDSVHPPADIPDLWLEAQRDQCLELLYPGKGLGDGAAAMRAMDLGLTLAVDVSHIFIQREQGAMSAAVWRRLQDYEAIGEVHVSANDGRRDQHQPVQVSQFGLGWARERGTSGTPVIFEAYMHRLSDDARQRQIDIVRGTEGLKR